MPKVKVLLTVDEVEQFNQFVNSGQARPVGNRVPDGDYVGVLSHLEEASTRADENRTYQRVQVVLSDRTGKTYATFFGLTNEAIDAFKVSKQFAVNYKTPENERYPKITFLVGMPEWVNDQVRTSVNNRFEMVRAALKNQETVIPAKKGVM